jgi:hypothetical protein
MKKSFPLYGLEESIQERGVEKLKCSSPTLQSIFVGCENAAPLLWDSTAVQW